MIIFEHNYNVNIDVEKTTDIDVFSKSKKRKIAVIQKDYHVRSAAPLIELFNQLPTDALVVFISMELHISTLIFISRYNSSKYTYIIGGLINDQMSVAANVVYNSSWLTSTNNIYRDYELPCTDAATKPYHFEIMYGLLKPHREFVHSNISHFRSKVFETPFLEISSCDSGAITNNDYWEDDIEILPGKTRVMFNNYVILPSQVVPFKIYAKATYSIVCETNYHNWFSFFTEKIAKPIIAGRLFIVISGQHYLSNLRKLGFKTFNGIIDESYDQIENDNERWLAALAEAHKLTLVPRVEVLAKCNDIFLHNQQMISKLELPENTVESIIKNL